jgi:hypothetical protein
VHFDLDSDEDPEDPEDAPEGEMEFAEAGETV